MASATVKIVEGDYESGLSAFETDIQTWLTANALGVIKGIMLVGDRFVAILEIPPTA